MSVTDLLILCTEAAAATTTTAGRDVVIVIISIIIGASRTTSVRPGPPWHGHAEHIRQCSELLHSHRNICTQAG